MDIGTADELSLDILINLLVNFSQEYVGIKCIYFGGNNPDWPLPKDKEKVKVIFILINFKVI